MYHDVHKNHILAFTGEIELNNKLKPFCKNINSLHTFAFKAPLFVRSDKKIFCIIFFFFFVVI